MLESTLGKGSPDIILPSGKFYKQRPCKIEECQTSNFIKRIEDLCAEFQENPLPADFKSRIDGATVIWKVFKRQQQAIDFALSYNEDIMIFAFEERIPHNKGKRSYLVTNPRHMWQIHKNRPSLQRCSYEVIREDSLCKLYFDLEFDKKYNEGKDGDEMVHIFIQCVCTGLKERYNIACSKSQVLWLDSSSETKFSSHLVFQIDGTAFKNNVEVGNFVNTVYCSVVKCITNKDTEQQKHDTLDMCHVVGWPSADKLQKLMVKDKSGKDVFFCDLGVYTKNRNFRLFLSTKFGKNAPLVLSRNNEYLPQTKTDIDWEEAVFLDSLVTYLRGCRDIRILTCCLPDAEQPQHLKNIKHETFSPSECELQGFHNSPYPEIDEFIQHIVINNEKPGFIRKWSYFSDKEVLIYDIANYRYCENVGRHHRSNNIFFVADLRKGVFYQKCYDPDCREQDFKTQAQSLPREVLPLYYCEEDLFKDDAIWNSPNLIDEVDMTFISRDEEICMVEAAIEAEKSFLHNNST